MLSLINIYMCWLKLHKQTLIGGLNIQDCKIFIIFCEIHNDVTSSEIDFEK